MPYLKLKVCNWGVATSEVIGLLSEFAERGFINAGEVLYYQLLYRTAGANPHDVVFGKAFVYSEAFISLILAHSKNAAAPSLPEVREILNAIPGLADAYELDVKGEDWKLSLKAPLLNRAFHPSDWAAHDWELFFDMGSDDLHFLSWPGSQFHRLIGSFAMLNGDRTEAEIYDSWGGDTRYLDYFLGFVAAAGLLLRSEHPFQSPAEEHAPAAGIELLCHSSLRIRQGSDHILVDPVLLVPPPLNRTPAYAERFDRLTSQFAGVTGVMISHHHWDHLNLQTLARIPRHIPIYIPPHTKTSRNTGCNPDIAAFLASIGFTKIVPLEWNSEHPVGDTRVTGLPFYGEWFGPDSAFDGCTFLAAINSKRM